MIQTAKLTMRHYPFKLLPLPYEYSALEPFIDKLTMEIHHDRHLRTYVNNLNAALKPYPAFHSRSIERLIKNAAQLPETIRTDVLHNAGGVYNHEFYFANLKPAKTESKLSPKLESAIDKTFGSYCNFRTEFKTAALGVFGSGYACLAVNGSGGLFIKTPANQDTVLPQNLRPVMLIDVWEHAYYLKHYNVREDYIDAWFSVVNLTKASENFERQIICLPESF
jgi:Fe-Mn family superoxide dismutase